MGRNSKRRRDAKKRKKIPAERKASGFGQSNSTCHGGDTKLYCEPVDGMPIEEFVLRNVSCSFRCQYGMKWAAQFPTDYAQRVSRDFFHGDAPLCVKSCGFLGHLVDTLKHQKVVVVSGESEPVLKFFVTTDNRGTHYTSRTQML